MHYGSTWHILLTKDFRCINLQKIYLPRGQTTWKATTTGIAICLKEWPKFKTDCQESMLTQPERRQLHALIPEPGPHLSGADRDVSRAQSVTFDYRATVYPADDYDRGAFGCVWREIDCDLNVEFDSPNRFWQTCDIIVVAPHWWCVHVRLVVKNTDNYQLVVLYHERLEDNAHSGVLFLSSLVEPPFPCSRVSVFSSPKNVVWCHMLMRWMRAWLTRSCDSRPIGSHWVRTGNNKLLSDRQLHHTHVAGEALDVAVYTSTQCTSSADTCVHVGLTSGRVCSEGASLSVLLLQMMLDQCLL